MAIPDGVPMTVVVAMSGGVDSSVAAALLVEQGHRVIGMMLRLWSEPGCENENRCCTPDDLAQARRVASRLEIPFYAIDAREQFREIVVQSFLDGHAAGITPNPCLNCNRHVRWGLLLKQATNLGATHLATGHYARVEKSAGGAHVLKTGIDAGKDQSYVLSVLNQDQLAHTLLPLGGFQKPEVRQMARRFGLDVAEKSDSQDLCFLGGQDYRDFLARYAPQTQMPGRSVDRHGNTLGEHGGLANYTIGQRKGLGLSSEAPLFVLKKDIAENTLVVGYKEELGSDHFFVSQFNWISGKIPGDVLRGEVKIRYKARPARATVHPQADGSVTIALDEPLRDITPGQLAVVYQEDTVIGSGIISVS